MDDELIASLSTQDGHPAMTEGRNPASERLDELTSLELVRLMNAEDATIAAAIGAEAQNIAAAIDRIVDRLRGGGRLVYLGAGTSGRLGVLDAAECPPTFNAPNGQVLGLIAGGPEALTQAIEGAEDHPELAQRDLAGISLQAADAVVGIATSGRTPYVVAGLRWARGVGACTIAFTCNHSSSLAAEAELAITPVVGPEVLSGSTRLKAGTATKMVLNMLSTGVMVRLGKTYGNQMVDLRATNSKLVHRSRRIVAQLAGIEPDQARRILDSCGGEVKTAIVAAQFGISPIQARRRLDAAAGQLRAALAGSSHPATAVRVSLPAAKPASHDNAVAPGQLVLGIDGGGSGTLAILARHADGRHPLLLGRGTAGPSNPQSVGFSAACTAIDLAVANAFVDAGVPSGCVASACLALAGAGRDDDRSRLQQWAADNNVARRITLVHDGLPVLQAGTPDGWGVALIAGTGSLAYGRNRSGAQARAGGWGHLVGDEGSAYSMAVQGLRLALHAADGRGEPTLLVERLMSALRIDRAEQFVPALYTSGRDRRAVACLAPEVTRAAEHGDAVAARIVGQAADELAAMVCAVARKLDLTGQEVPLALCGGAILGSNMLSTLLVERITQRGFIVQPIAKVTEPALGAVRIALEPSMQPCIQEVS